MSGVLLCFDSLMLELKLILSEKLFICNYVSVVFVFAAVCVAGYSASKNEILELRLPPKLFADNNKVIYLIIYIHFDK